ncbi:MAG: GNAT family N-acetyltransferase [Phototrophicaceae bacterium]
MYQLETERLRLRPLLHQDLPMICEYLQDVDIHHNTLLIPYPYHLEHAESFLQMVYEQFANASDYVFALSLKSDQRFMGVISLHLLPHAKGEVGYWLGKPHWGQGYMSEALQRVIAFGFTDLGLQRIQATHFTHNVASGRVMQKANMTREGILRHWYHKDGKPVDVCMYSILREEYLALPPHHPA